RIQWPACLRTHASLNRLGSQHSADHELRGDTAAPREKRALAAAAKRHATILSISSRFQPNWRIVSFLTPVDTISFQISVQTHVPTADRMLTASPGSD